MGSRERQGSLQALPSRQTGKWEASRERAREKALCSIPRNLRGLPYSLSMRHATVKSETRLGARLLPSTKSTKKTGFGTPRSFQISLRVVLTVLR